MQKITVLKDPRKMFYGASGAIFSLAEELRSNLTSSEVVLWNALRLNKLGARFKSQHPVSKWIVDFYCHAYKLAIEIDGGYHETNDQKEKDSARTFEMEKLGLTILRFTNQEVEKDIDRVINEIKIKLKKCVR